MIPSTQNSPSSNQSNNNHNYAAAFFQMITVALLCTCLAQPSWLTLNFIDKTNKMDESCPKHLTLYQFIDYGYFETMDASNGTYIVPLKLYYHSAIGVMGCLTPLVVNLFKVVMMLVIFAICFSFFGFLLDVLGTKSRFCTNVRVNGLLTIPIVLLCAGIVSLLYYTTVLIERENHRNPVEVTFDYGFFTLSAAGATSLLATASSLFMKESTSTSSRRNGSRSRTRQHQHHRSRSRLLRSTSTHQLVLCDDVESQSSVPQAEPPPPYSL